ncbi:phosphoadenylyl-sulfate reductase [Sulfurospirillum multivorans]|uniref:Adenosine 5'-phosphosulfate reductase n=2 Tax=Sulfurospirillum multivorans TaxID=66821 RepID=A0AA86DZF0_SULMK|nr:phosphoadenylyl-sulfate reductase [Sulfurospirillum multivorans]AHJ14313.1 phosphoadenosine phosphosulfate reductase [Sulfurospirillum multivorans DSM 12446]QEH07799.1 phosphoadenosine phosphosulfate reductase [Sulfurospirillum multivorans]
MSQAYDIKIAEAINTLKELIGDKALNVTLAFSHQSEDAINISLAQKAGIDFDVFTLETHKLFDESLAYEKEIEAFFGVEIKRFSANDEQIKDLEAKVGEFGIFDDIDLRKECCHVRKLIPLARALKGYHGWISGIRIAQSITRSDTKLVEFDGKFELLKFNPLTHFSDEDVERYMTEFAIPQNSLYAKGFKSIGCKPCTRAISEGEDIRAGRWWWENPEHKECGLHLHKEK